MRFLRFLVHFCKFQTSQKIDPMSLGLSIEFFGRNSSDRPSLGQLPCPVAVSREWGYMKQTLLLDPLPLAGRRLCGELCTYPQGSNCSQEVSMAVAKEATETFWGPRPVGLEMAVTQNRKLFHSGTHWGPRGSDRRLL